MRQNRAHSNEKWILQLHARGFFMISYSYFGYSNMVTANEISIIGISPFSIILYFTIRNMNKIVRAL